MLAWIGTADAAMIGEQYGNYDSPLMERRMACAEAHGLVTAGPTGDFELTEEGWGLLGAHVDS
jgi:hypothetical protein